MLKFALNPVKDIDIEDLRAVILSYIIAKQKNEKLLIKIEDGSRSQEKELLDILNLFSIDYNKVVYQSENLKYYQRFAMQLLTTKEAFNCFCSDEALQKDKLEAQKNNKPYRYSGFCENLSDETILNIDAPFRVRIKKPSYNIKFKDLIRGEYSYKAIDIDSFVILNQNKTATYNFASAIDDMLYDVSTVITQEEFLDDTPRQIYIRELLGYTKQIDYIHLPKLFEDSKILVKELLDMGYLPVAIANYIVLLGYKAPVEFFTLEDAIKWFDISKLSLLPVKFDIKQLDSINKEYIKLLDDLRLSKILGYADEDIGKLAKLYLNNFSTIKQIKDKIDKIFSNKDILEDFKDEIIQLKSCLQKAPFIDDFNEFKNYLIKNTNLQESQLSIPLRFILTGETDGPDLNKIYPLIKNYLGEIVC